jgi:drug/metabolite transporter (DMT)-like permease
MTVLPVSVVTFIGGLPLTIPAAALELGTLGLGPLSWGAVLRLLYVGVISPALAMYLWHTAFARLAAGVASLTFFAQPVVGAALGALLLGETLTPLFLAGGLLIGLGLLLAAKS